MDIIFLDTSIFEANNFLESKRIKEIYKLAEKEEIKVVIPKLTYDEILSRISKNINDADSKFNKYRNETRVLRNASSLEEKFTPFKKEEVLQEVSKKIEKQFEKSKFEIIDYSSINVKGIFDNYFHGNLPFGEGKKKSEFPDAFALKFIEIWAEENNTKVFVFSKDGDMLGYENEYIEIKEDFNKYLSDKIVEVELEINNKRIDFVEDWLNNPPNNIIEEIKQWVTSQLDDYTKYYNHSNYHEIHDLSIINVEVEIYDFYSITSTNDEYVSVELDVLVEYEVEITIDDEEFMYRDPETREWVYTEKKPVLVEGKRYINLDVIFYFDEDNTIIDEVEIESINKGQSLSV